MNRAELGAARPLTRHTLAAAHDYWQMLCRPRDLKTIKAECANTQPLIISKTSESNVTRLPRKAQSDLKTIKRNLISSLCAGRIRVEFVQRVFSEWPELEAA